MPAEGLEPALALRREGFRFQLPGKPIPPRAAQHVEFRGEPLNSSYSETWRGHVNRPEPETPTSLPASSLEPHYSVQVLAELWRLDESTIRRIFEAAPGVLRLGNDKRRTGKREYFTLRIPASVAEREYQRRIVAASNKGRG